MDFLDHFSAYHNGLGVPLIVTLLSGQIDDLISLWNLQTRAALLCGAQCQDERRYVQLKVLPFPFSRTPPFSRTNVHFCDNWTASETAD